MEWTDGRRQNYIPPTSSGDKKLGEKLVQARYHCLFAFRWIPNTKIWNTQFKIWNTQSQKEVGKYPIASNPYLELWSKHVIIRWIPADLAVQFDYY